nr:hypothetical protein CFP56_20678 [Quercus suber]
MSFWERYFAPGDVRQQYQFASPSTDLSVDGITASQEPGTQDRASALPPLERIDPAHRERRKLALLYGGLSFTFLSLFITRRALRSKQLQIYPATFTPSNKPPEKVNGGLEAAEALGLATLNVFSIAMASAGALMTFFDVADVEDMRERVRRGVGFDVYAGDAETDKELEDWVAETMSKQDGLTNLHQGVLEKLAELSEKEKRLKEDGTEGVLEKLAELREEKNALSSEVRH